MFHNSYFDQIPMCDSTHKAAQIDVQDGLVRAFGYAPGSTFWPYGILLSRRLSTELKTCSLDATQPHWRRD